MIPKTLDALRSAAAEDPALLSLLLDVEDRIEAAFRAGAAADRAVVQQHVARERTRYAAQHGKATSEASKQRLAQHYDLLGIVIADLNPRFPFGIPLASPEMSHGSVDEGSGNVTGAH